MSKIWILYVACVIALAAELALESILYLKSDSKFWFPLLSGFINYISAWFVSFIIIEYDKKILEVDNTPALLNTNDEQQYMNH